MFIKLIGQKFFLKSPRGDVEMNVIKENYERMGDDGEWLRYVTSTILKSNIDDIEVNKKYIFVLENYETPNIVLDERQNYLTSLAI